MCGIVFNIFIFVLFNQPFDIIADRKTGNRQSAPIAIIMSAQQYNDMAFICIFCSIFFNRAIMNDWKTNWSNLKMDCIGIMPRSVISKNKSIQSKSAMPNQISTLPTTKNRKHKSLTMWIDWMTMTWKKIQSLNSTSTMNSIRNIVLCVLTLYRDRIYK